MTTMIENQNRQYGGVTFDSMYQQPHGQPQFTDPWASSSHSSHSNNPSIYTSSISMNAAAKQGELNRPNAISLPYASIPVSAPSLVASSNYSATGYTGQEILGLHHDIPRSSFEQAPPYTTAAPIGGFTPATFAGLSYTSSLHHPQDARKYSHPTDARIPGTQAQSQAAPTYGDTLDASRGMVALSQDLTPRNVYAPRGSRTSTDSYGFPSTHSSASSISSASNYPYYSASVSGSIDSSVTDYSSTTSESYDNLPSRTLPRLNSLMAGNAPPGPQSMMGQFSSKMPSNTQKKHKCKVCDKRFTRPSSLQTHMYSHTGEKPYACEVEGCGRHFSVVSNLRRHKKVHKGEKESGSGEDEE
jgi:hypothetical protein